ncbi:hypothetical protein [Plantibacter flavus]|uniref:hypothetical protein n=1 Tax=Plantibacter flavus TaxID=150123 RepID=UPI00137639B0|nr:hypothetical protein [Plantibacter flavus]
MTPEIAPEGTSTIGPADDILGRAFPRHQGALILFVLDRLLQNLVASKHLAEGAR